MELIGGVVLETDKASFSTSDVTCKGEVTVNTRKQKTIFLYELEIGFKWTGELIGKDGKKFKGNVSLPYISEENDDDDFEVKVSVEESGGDAETLRGEVRAKIIPFLKEKVPQMLQEMRGVATGKTKLPPKKQVPVRLDTVAPITPSQEKASGPLKVKDQESFTITEKFLCSPRDLFECFVDNARAKSFAGGDSIVSREKGGKFRLFGGSVEGENIEVDNPKKLVQKWRFSSWPEGHYSTVTITLEEKDNKTICKLTQVGVPSEDMERTEKGWSSNFWTRIKGVFGFGSML